MAGSSSSILDWKFSQVFGERSPGEDVENIDVISAIEFDKSGDYLAVGDRGGRVVIFEKKAGKDVTSKQYSRNELEKSDVMVLQHPEYRYKTEFQSHEPEVKERKLKKVKEMDLGPYVSSENALLSERSFVSGESKSSVANGLSLEWIDKMETSISVSNAGHMNGQNIGETAFARCRKMYAHAHDYNINSISNNSDGETFISADDLRINLWNLEVSDQCFNIIDMKPPNMDDLTEVITSAEFHPLHCNLLAYSSSRGFIRLVDMRQSALCDRSSIMLHDAEPRGQKTFFTEIIASISSIKFAPDGRHILSRDYMNLKFWDMRMPTSPVVTYKIHDHLRPKLGELYNNDAIFDKFDCCLSGDGTHFATGSYSNHMRIYGVGSEEGTTLEASRNSFRKRPPQATSKVRRSSLSNLTRGFYRQGHNTSESENNEFSCDLNSKLLHLAWHPKSNMIACSTGNSLFMYYA
ncbi:serine/threonine protein phosphatase 2A 55 kDa regulatory subunit B beta isoform-like isoform X2 [Cynara cardunculus var. scolymus]|uniref:serine/threonine protein phosphatase 2A 55 kDa regulatory subunit B beta isoform-like isoform X2 n=1 Tax=Cynara cardunculus var. scolymus TaxID=59895 RepID=UPI000D62DFFD|nr:serine/threonine protein phosphatase 2A 55 kDa regulatory subunit B beta isoform-like isoform X2 [Cynara cardunculus var. scolymus]